MTPEPAADTCERILDSAEKLFAARGYGSTSLRSITTDAKVNLAAINYHFKSKEGLLTEVLHRRIDPINAERLALLDQLEAEGDYAPVRILRAFLEPALRLKEQFASHGEAVATIVGRLHADPPGIAGDLFQELFRGVFLRFDKALQRALPDLSDADRALRFHIVVGSLIHVMHFGDAMKKVTGHLPPDNRASDLLDHLVAFTSAGLTAPVPFRKPEAGEVAK
jgi:AcrR family transcriptional regulator